MRVENPHFHSRDAKSYNIKSSGSIDVFLTLNKKNLKSHHRVYNYSSNSEATKEAASKLPVV